MQANVATINPMLSMQLPNDLPWQIWIDCDLELVSRCDFVVRYGRTKGGDIEVAHARKLGIPVCHVHEVPELAGIVVPPHLEWRK